MKFSISKLYRKANSQPGQRPSVPITLSQRFCRARYRDRSQRLLAVCEPGGLPGPLGIQSLISNSAQPPELSQAISALDSTLTQFDSLKNALQQNLSPKQINSLIEQINEQTAGLDDKMSGLPADHQLRNMAEELKVTAYMESLKWKRGDYL